MQRRRRLPPLKADYLKAFRDRLREVVGKYETRWSDFNIKLINEKEETGYHAIGLGTLLHQLDSNHDAGEPTSHLRNVLHELRNGQARLLIIKRLQDALTDFEEGPELLTVGEFENCLSCVDEIVGGEGPAPPFPDSELYSPIVQHFWSYSRLAAEFARKEYQNASLGGYQRGYRGVEAWQPLQSILPNGFQHSSKASLDRAALCERKRLYLSLREHASTMRGINALRHESIADSQKQIQEIVAQHRAEKNAARDRDADSSIHSASIAHVPVSRRFRTSSFSFY
ncbi:hypothetical protein JCM3765_004310 [Sporobolomyces pararoseus]